MRDLHKTDPEFMKHLDYFALEEVVRENGQQLGESVRYMVILASLIGCQGTDTSREIFPSALDGGLTPMMVKEIVYQSVNYMGVGRTRPFLSVIDEVLESREVPLSLLGQATTTMEDQLEKSSQAQVDIFGERIRDFWKKRYVNCWLAVNCFGDYCTRRGLDLAQRELITFCFLAAQDGREPQLISHAAANVRLGNTKEYLMKAISQCLPYIGYPCSLNAVARVEKVQYLKGCAGYLWVPRCVLWTA